MLLKTITAFPPNFQANKNLTIRLSSWLLKKKFVNEKKYEGQLIHICIKHIRTTVILEALAGKAKDGHNKIQKIKEEWLW